MKSVVTMARFQLKCMFDWGYTLRTYRKCLVSDIIVPRRILYKESNYCVFVFVLASVSHCLFLATVVVQDLFDEFILEFIWQVICIYVLKKISRFVWYSCVAV